MEPLKQFKLQKAMEITDNSFTELYQKFEGVMSADYLQGMQDLRNKIITDIVGDE